MKNRNHSFVILLGLSVQNGYGNNSFTFFCIPQHQFNLKSSSLCEKIIFGKQLINCDCVHSHVHNLLHII